MAMGYAASGREMTVGGVLGRAFAAIGAAPVRFFGTSLVLSGLPYAASSLIGRGAPAPSVGASPAAAFASQPWGMLIAIWTVYFVLYLLAKAILIRTTVTVDGDRPGETFGETAAAALRVLLPLIGATLLYYLGVWAGSILLIVPGIILALMWVVIAPVLVQERVGVVAAFGRSRWLTKGARLRILGLCIVVFAVYLVFVFALGAAGFGMRLGTAAAAVSPTVVSVVLSVAMQSAFLAIWTAVQTSLYLDLREWKDGVAGDRLSEIFA